MTILRMNPYEGDSKTAAFFDIETTEGITIKGFTLIEGTKGLFVGMPSEKGRDDKYYDKVVMTNEKKKQLSDMAIEKYNELTAL
jgi:DNA-binding cell septation regulator SpoVG